MNQIVDLAWPAAQLVYMDYSPAPEIIRLATEAAHEVAGADATVEVEAEIDLDSTQQPAYYFSYQLLKGPSYDIDPGLVHIRLVQHIIDKLVARGDTHYPYIRKLVISEAQPSGA